MKRKEVEIITDNRLISKKTEQHFGVPPEVVNIVYHCKDTFTVHKAAKKGQNSFRITKSLLESLLKTQAKIQKKPTLIISIVDGSAEYTITCSITKR